MKGVAMKKIIAGMAVGVLMAVVVQTQAAMSGRWQGESPNGSHVVLEVKASDTALTGTLTVDGQRLTLADGKVAKNTFTFTVTLPPNNAEQPFTGELTQDQIRLWMNRRGPANAAVLTRSKD